MLATFDRITRRDTGVTRGEWWHQEDHGSAAVKQLGIVFSTDVCRLGVVARRLHCGVMIECPANWL